LFDETFDIRDRWPPAVGQALADNDAVDVAVGHFRLWGLPKIASTTGEKGERRRKT
jgi:hypothetical protein